MTPDKFAVARQLYDSHKHTLAAIATTIEVSRSTPYRHLAATGGWRIAPCLMESCELQFTYGRGRQERYLRPLAPWIEGSESCCPCLGEDRPPRLRQPR